MQQILNKYILELFVVKFIFQQIAKPLNRFYINSWLNRTIEIL